MDEKKTYDIIGRVSIGTDEYKDLITDKFKAEQCADRYMRDGWDKEKQINQLKKELEEATTKIAKYEQIIKRIAPEGVGMIFSIGE